MRPLPLARTPLSPVTVDACDNCQALWLDATESQQLTPGALIELFRAIGASQRDARTAYPALLPCPRCTTPLSLTRDVRLNGNRAVTLQVNATNLFNTVQWTVLDTDINSPTYGHVVGVKPMRAVTLGLRFRF